MTSPIPKHAPGRALPATETQPAVFHDSPLRHELHRTLHEAKLSTEELAWRLGLSPSYLYRAVLTTTSAVRFPADLLAELMRQCGDYRTLEYLARECGYIAVPVAKIRRAKKTPAEVGNETAAGFHAWIADLMAFFSRPEHSAAAAIRGRLRRQLADLAVLDQAIQTFAQMELF